MGSLQVRRCLQDPAKVSADAHRHYLSDNAGPKLSAPQSRVIRNSIARPSAASVRGVSAMTAQMPYPLSHNCARIQWCLDTIVIGAGSAIAQPRNAPNKGQATAPLLL
jgi:hypothetical protein